MLGVRKSAKSPSEVLISTSGRSGTPLQANQYSEQQNDSMPNSRTTTANYLSIVLWHSMTARLQERNLTMMMYMFVMLAVQEKLRFRHG